MTEWIFDSCHIHNDDSDRTETIYIFFGAELQIWSGSCGMVMNEASVGTKMMAANAKGVITRRT